MQTAPAVAVRMQTRHGTLSLGPLSISLWFLMLLIQLDMRNRFRGNPGAKISSRLQEEQAQDLA